MSPQKTAAQCRQNPTKDMHYSFTTAATKNNCKHDKVVTGLVHVYCIRCSMRSYSFLTETSVSKPTSSLNHWRQGAWLSQRDRVTVAWVSFGQI